MFKEKWKKKSSLVKVSNATIIAMIHQAGFKASQWKILDGGCANLNIKLFDETSLHFYILRIYLRHKDAVFLEYNLSTLLKSTIPIPEIYYKGEYENTSFAVVKYIKGISLRQVLLEKKYKSLSSIMHTVGEALGKIHSFKFNLAGTFNEDFKIIPRFETNYITYGLNLLSDKNIQYLLDSKLIEHCTCIFDKYFSLNSSSQPNSLVHGDFDPANILVIPQYGDWKISGIMDWEYSFSGLGLWDISNMLRYADQLPKTFTNSFLQGYQKSGGNLSDYYKIEIILQNMVSLLEILTHTSAIKQPNQFQDIVSLLKHFIQKMKVTKDI